MRYVFLKSFTLVGALMLLTHCGDGSDSFSLLSDGDVFQQSPGVVNSKVDILWMVDNSGSMQSSQDNLADNFSAFIADFQTKNLDFKMAFSSTDAYKKIFYSNAVDCAPFRDGPRRWSSSAANCILATGGIFSGIDILLPSTPDLTGKFIINVKQGTTGSGDERAFQSMKISLDDPSSAGFVRSDSFLAVVIVSDEEDYSHDGSSSISPNRNHQDIHSIDSYVTYLDTLTNSSGANRRYSVSSIAIYDQTCLDLLNHSSGGRQLGTRYGELSDATGGIKSSLCGDFATELEKIADNILSLATQFVLSRLPIESSIVVKVNDAIVPNVNSNPGPLTGGWEYIPSANAIRFYGDYIPAAGSSIAVTFDPLAYGS